MVKTTQQRKSSAPVAQDDIDNTLSDLGARKLFVSSAMNMGWQMAGMVLIPVFIGVKLDQHFHSSPSYTLAALIISVCGAVYIVGNTIKQVNRDQQDAENEELADKVEDNK